MSRVDTRRKVRQANLSIETQRSATINGSSAFDFIAQSISSLSATAKAAFDELSAMSGHTEIGHVSQSTASLKAQFNKTYVKNEQAALEKGLSAVEARQVAFTATARSTPLMVMKDTKLGSQTIDWSDPSQLETVMNQVALEHNQIFMKHLQETVQQASVEIGFTNTTIESSQVGFYRVRAENEKGHLLVTDIRSNKEHDVEMVTETLNIRDNSCSYAMEAFDEALKRRGVLSDDPESKSTGLFCSVSHNSEIESEVINPQAEPQRRRMQQKSTNNLTS